jgi:hypothetical protein
MPSGTMKASPASSNETWCAAIAAGFWLAAIDDATAKPPTSNTICSIAGTPRRSSTARSAATGRLRTRQTGVPVWCRRSCWTMATTGTIAITMRATNVAQAAPSVPSAGRPRWP